MVIVSVITDTRCSTIGFSKLPSRAVGVVSGQGYNPIVERHVSVVIHKWGEEESS